MKYKIRILLYFRRTFLAILCVFSTIAIAESSKPPASDENRVSEKSTAFSSGVARQLELLTLDIENKRSELAALDEQINTAVSDKSRQALVEKRVKLGEQLEKSQRSLEQLATGAVDLDLFEKPVDTRDFSWQEELKEVFRPIIMEMKKLTERPRQIEQLRTQNESLATRLEAAKLAITEIQELSKVKLAPDVKQRLDELEEKWIERRDTIQRELELVDFQLDERLNVGETKSAAIAKAFGSFLTGRGLNILLAIIAFVVTFFIFRYLSYLLEKWISRGQDSESRFLSRLTHVILQILTVFISTLALLAVLYTLGDWLLLTLIIILLVGVVFALRNSLPRYIDEVRLLLNIGPVREGERVIYHGLPYNVSRLNIYSTLVNPMLRGGRLRLPLREIGPLVSRRYSKEEPWFPSRADDWVILSDESFGKVLIQTPEIVQLKLVGGAIKNFPIGEFLELYPVNLSYGFGLFVSFGLDYKMQKSITSKALAQMESGVKKQFEESKFAEYLEKFAVEFEQAGSSSLDLSLRFNLSGDAACFYYAIRRFIQSCAVNVCNEQAWTIPFSQLTVHMNENN